MLFLEYIFYCEEQKREEIRWNASFKLPKKKKKSANAVLIAFI